MQASLVVEGLTPHQKMLRLASKQTGAAAYFNLKPSRVKDQTYTITITSNSIDKQVGSQVRHSMLQHCIAFYAKMCNSAVSA